MKEIKFRGQTIKGEWEYGLLCKPLVGENKGKVFISNDGGMPMAYEVRPETVGQFTGHIIDGKEMYEGDILEWLQTPSGYPEDKRLFRHTVVIRWEKMLRCTDLWSFYNYKIIGNIHENPELAIHTPAID